jgi:transposase
VIPTQVQIYVASQPVDFRRSFDGLAAAAREVMKLERQSGALFVFCNRRLDRLKALWWDTTGYCLLYKRLERGCFRLPKPLSHGQAHVSIDQRELAGILSGVDLPRRSVHIAAS